MKASSSKASIYAAGAVGLVAFALGACAHQSQSGANGWYSTTSLTGGTAPAINDAQIAEIERASLAAAEAEAKTAADHAHDPGVKAFAERARDDYGVLLRGMHTLLTRDGVTPQASPQSDQITEQSRRAEAKMAWQQRDDFDQAYVKRAVALQQSMLDTLDFTLLRAAGHEDLESELLRTRTVVAQDLNAARELADRLLSKP